MSRKNQERNLNDAFVCQLCSNNVWGNPDLSFSNQVMTRVKFSWTLNPNHRNYTFLFFLFFFSFHCTEARRRSQARDGTQTTAVTMPRRQPQGHQETPYTFFFLSNRSPRCAEEPCGPAQHTSTISSETNAILQSKKSISIFCKGFS